MSGLVFGVLHIVFPCLISLFLLALPFDLIVFVSSAVGLLSQTHCTFLINKTFITYQEKKKEKPVIMNKDLNMISICNYLEEILEIPL